MISSRPIAPTRSGSAGQRMSSSVSLGSPCSSASVGRPSAFRAVATSQLHIASAIAALNPSKPSGRLSILSSTNALSFSCVALAFRTSIFVKDPTTSSKRFRSVARMWRSSRAESITSKPRSG